MSHPTCAECGKEILPGSDVNIINPDFDPEDVENKIYTEDDILLTHVTCPE